MFIFTATRFVTVDPASCLERGVNYSIRIDFNRYKSDQLTPDATALIDSVCIFFKADLTVIINLLLSQNHICKFTMVCIHTAVIDE